MSKNVLLLSLSKFPGRGEYLTIEEENKYRYTDENGKNFDITGYYQLEPVPNLLKAMGKPIDEIIALSTDETREPKNLEIKGDILQISVVEYFTNWIKSNFKDSAGMPTKCQVIELDEKNPAQAVSDIVDVFENHDETEKINLYVDTHGGFRNIQLISEAIVQLWQDDHINLEVFNVRFNRGGISPIEKDNAIKIFDFVSGINEFFNYGRINSLLRFLENDDTNALKDADLALVKPLTEISEGIQWCNVKNFEDGLKHLKNYYKQKKLEVSNPYLKIFEGKIKQDFGEVLDEEKIEDAVEMVRWCMKKGFYQQALTLIESRMPETLKNRGIIKLTDRGNEFVSQNNLSVTEVYNGCITDYKDWLKVWSRARGNRDRMIFNQIFKIDEEENGRRTEQILREIEKLSYYTQGYYRDFIQNHKASSIKHPNLECDNAIRFSTDGLDSDNKKFRKMVLLNYMHATLKDARNAANHALTDSGYNIEALKNAVKYYLDLIDDLTPHRN